MTERDKYDDLMDKWRLKFAPAAEMTEAEQVAMDAFRDIDNLVLDVRKYRRTATRWRTGYEEMVLALLDAGRSLGWP